MFLVIGPLHAHCQSTFPKDSLTRVAIDLYEKGEYKQAIIIFEDRLKIADKQNDAEWQSVLLTNLGNAHSQIGNSVVSVKYYQKALTISEQIGDKKRIARILKNIGSLYSEQKDFTNALNYYAKAEAVARQNKDTPVLADCANNKAIVYEQQMRFQEAISSYHEALSIYQQMNAKDRIALTLNNLGVVYKNTQNYPASINYYSRSLEISEKLGDQFMVAANLTNLGNVYLKTGSHGRALELHQKALRIARGIDAMNVVVEVYSSLSEDYAGLEDFRAALDWHRKYSLLTDSLINKERSQQIGELEKKYEIEKKEREIEALTQSQKISSLELKGQRLVIEKYRYQLVGIAGIVLLSALVAFLLYNRQKFRQRQLQEKAVLDAEFKERMRIARDVHDDLGSGLSRISLMASLAERKVTGDHQKDIRSIAGISKELVDNMRDLVWVLNPDNTTMDHLLARIREYCGDYCEEAGISAEVVFPDKRPGLKIARGAQRNLFLTVKEAIHNTVKHAQATSIKIQIAYNDGGVRISITDNGKGFGSNRQHSAGNGLKNMRHRIESLGGSFDLTSDGVNGTSILIEVPFVQLVTENIIL
jgi:two-component system NarL family sensor kinase